jgi:hypothetical protein
VAAARLAAFAFGESVLTKCGRPFDPADASALAQITCTSVSAAATAAAAAAACCGSAVERRSLRPTRLFMAVRRKSRLLQCFMRP